MMPTFQQRRLVEILFTRGTNLHKLQPCFGTGYMLQYGFPRCLCKKPFNGFGIYFWTDFSSSYENNATPRGSNNIAKKYDN